MKANKNIDFNSEKAVQRIYSFTKNYGIVSDVIFGDIEDTSDYQSKILEGKIDKVLEIAKIYRKYVSKDRMLSSLSSGEGSSLDIHLAYYLSILKTPERNEILKRLL